MLLKNTTLQIRLVKDTPQEVGPETSVTKKPSFYIPKQTAIDVAVFAGTIYTGVKLLNTGCKIAIIAAKAKL